MSPQKLFRPFELAFRTQYAELKEQVRAAGELLPGTPGTLYLRRGSGQAYWYRVYYPVPGKQAETLVGREDDQAAYLRMQDAVSFSQWVGEQVGALRKLGFQVADKTVARVLVELHRLGALEGGLVLVGTLAYMAWLNEFGASAVAARTQDIDLARRQALKLATPLEFLPALRGTGLPFVAVPGLPSSQPSTSVKLPGIQGLRVDILAPGTPLGQIIPIPELDWAAQAVPHYDYLLADPEPAALLAGGHCIPLRLPQAGRMVWHKLYASSCRRGFPEKTAKDRLQAATLAALLLEHDPEALARSLDAAPEPLRAALPPLRSPLAGLLAAHPEARDALLACLDTL